MTKERKEVCMVDIGSVGRYLNQEISLAPVPGLDVLQVVAGQKDQFLPGTIGTTLKMVESGVTAEAPAEGVDEGVDISIPFFLKTKAQIDWHKTFRKHEKVAGLYNEMIQVLRAKFDAAVKYIGTDEARKKALLPGMKNLAKTLSGYYLEMAEAYKRVKDFDKAIPSAKGYYEVLATLYQLDVRGGVGKDMLDAYEYTIKVYAGAIEDVSGLLKFGDEALSLSDEGEKLTIEALHKMKAEFYQGAAIFMENAVKKYRTMSDEVLVHAAREHEHAAQEFLMAKLEDSAAAEFEAYADRLDEYRKKDVKRNGRTTIAEAYDLAAQHYGSSAKKAEMYLKETRLLLDLMLFDRASDKMERAVECCVDSDNLDGAVGILWEYAGVREESGNYFDAMLLYEKAFRIADKDEQKEISFRRMGELTKTQIIKLIRGGKGELSQGMAHKYIEILKELDGVEPQRIREAYEFVGNLMASEKYYDGALRFYFDLIDRTEARDLRTIYFTRVADIYVKQSDYFHAAAAYSLVANSFDVSKERILAVAMMEKAVFYRLMDLRSTNAANGNRCDKRALVLEALEDYRNTAGRYLSDLSKTKWDKWDKSLEAVINKICMSVLALDLTAYKKEIEEIDSAENTHIEGTLLEIRKIALATLHVSEVPDSRAESVAAVLSQQGAFASKSDVERSDLANKLVTLWDAMDEGDKESLREGAKFDLVAGEIPRTWLVTTGGKVESIKTTATAFSSGGGAFRPFTGLEREKGFGHHPEFPGAENSGSSFYLEVPFRK